MCPECGAPLQQLGAVCQIDPGPGTEWLGENLYRCQECPYGSNRFESVWGKYLLVTPE